MGWIFAQSSEERDFIVSVEELKQMAAMQSEHGDTTVTAIVSLDMSENEGQVHFEVISKNPVFFNCFLGVSMLISMRVSVG